MVSTAPFGRCASREPAAPPSIDQVKEWGRACASLLGEYLLSKFVYALTITDNEEASLSPLRMVLAQSILTKCGIRCPLAGFVLGMQAMK